MRRAASFTLSAVLLLAAGCGGGDDDREQIESTIRGYFGAFAAAEGERACAELATHTQNTLIQNAGAGTCPEAIEKAREDPQIKRYLPELGNVEIESVRISGDRARATVSGIGQTTEVPLLKEDGDWKIEGVGEPATE